MIVCMWASCLCFRDKLSGCFIFILILCQDWQSATSLAKAFAIGPKESQAVFALLTHVPDAVRLQLELAVTTRGMQKFISHDTIGKGVFNAGWTSAGTSTEAWSEELTNTNKRTDLATWLRCAFFVLLPRCHVNL